MPDIPSTYQRKAEPRAAKDNKKAVHKQTKIVVQAAIAARNASQVYGDMEMKTTEINVKLDKLLGLNNEMEDQKTLLTEVENENKSLKGAMKSMNKEFEEMSTTWTTMGTITNKNSRYSIARERVLDFETSPH